MSVIEHLGELRRRLLVMGSFVLVLSIASFFYAGSLLEVLTRGTTLIYIRPAEAMLAYFRLAFIAGVMLSTPVIFYQFIAFLAPALNKREKRILLISIAMMFLLFATGICFAWFVVFPFAIDFFSSFASEQLLPWYTVSEYVSFATGLLLAFGLVFQLPMLFWVLGALRVVSAKFLRSIRKYAIIVVAVLAAFITPPDVVSQVLMILPMLALFELGIWLVVLTELGRRKKQTQTK